MVIQATTSFTCNATTMLRDKLNENVARITVLGLYAYSVVSLAYLVGNVTFLYFVFKQEAIAYFPLMILISGILMSTVMRRLNKYFTNRVCL